MGDTEGVMLGVTVGVTVEEGVTVGVMVAVAVTLGVTVPDTDGVTLGVAVLLGVGVTVLVADGDADTHAPMLSRGRLLPRLFGQERHDVRPALGWYSVSSHSAHSTLLTPYLPAAQAPQVVCPVAVGAVAYPSTQSRHAVSAVTFVKRPATHSKQADSLVDAPYRPASHSVHAVAAPVEYSPALHTSHAVACVELMNSPGGQAKHADRLLLGPYRPASQGVHAPAPGAAEWKPGPHAVHVAGDTAAVCGDAVPGAHRWQKEEPCEAW